MRLPNKAEIINWRHLPTIHRLMAENRWSLATSTEWFNDFMCWLYTSMRSKLDHDKIFIMDNMHYLDDVWHAYILHTRDYLLMSKTLFATDIIHHDPEDPFSREKIEDSVIEYQMEMLIEDWGNSYVDRVWQHGADIHDIIAPIV